MLDFEKRKKEIKKLIIAEKWPEDEAKVNEEYRSLSKQIDNFLNYLDDKTVPLYWLPINYMSNKEIAKIVCGYLDRKDKHTTNHCLRHMLSCDGWKYDYSCFIAPSLRAGTQSEILMDIELLMNEDEHLKIREMKNSIGSIWGAEKSNKDVLRNIMNEFQDMIISIFNEENYLFPLGVRKINGKYIEEMIDLVSYMARLVIKRLIVFNNKIDRIKDLRIICCYMDDEVDEMREYVENKKAIFREIREDDANKENDDVLSLLFSSYMKRKSLYDEYNKIIQIIEDDFPDFELMPTKDLDINEMISDWSEKGIKKYSNIGKKKLRKILHAEGMNEFYKKFNITEEFIQKYMENGGDKIYKVDVLQAVFAAIYHSNSKYERKRVSALIQDLLNLKYPRFEPKQWLFLDAKLEQIEFLKLGLKDGFPFYVHIIDTLNRLLLLPYATWNYEEVYRCIYRIGYDFLYLFLNNEDYKLDL